MAQQPTASEALNRAAARDVMRLGWMVAEVRGRYRLGDDSRLQASPPLDRTGRALPLANERSAAEQRIEAEVVLGTLANTHEIDFDAQNAQADGGLGFGRDPLPKDHATASEYLTKLAVDLAAARKASDAATTATVWAAMTELFYRWDARIQDELASGSFGMASAYQLGRGLAEVYWALDPAAADASSESWDHLLGDERYNTLATLLRRCSPTLPNLTAETITACLEQWKAVAADPAWRSGKTAVPALGLQAGVWRDLLLTGNEPQTLLATDQVLKRAQSLRPLIGSFIVEGGGLLIGLAAVAAAILCATLLGSGMWKAVGGVAFGILGAFGVTSSALLARVKAIGQGLLEEVRAKVTADAVIVTATYLPDPVHRTFVTHRKSTRHPPPRQLGPQMKYVDAASRRHVATAHSGTHAVKEEVHDAAVHN
jgi:hypothetical protein